MGKRNGDGNGFLEGRSEWILRATLGRPVLSRAIFRPPIIQIPNKLTEAI